MSFTANPMRKRSRSVTQESPMLEGHRSDTQESLPPQLTERSPERISVDSRSFLGRIARGQQNISQGYTNIRQKFNQNRNNLKSLLEEKQELLKPYKSILTVIICTATTILLINIGLAIYYNINAITDSESKISKSLLYTNIAGFGLLLFILLATRAYLKKSRSTATGPTE